MQIVIAMDSFKGSIASLDAAQAAAAGILAACPDAQVTCLPLADGGEGTADALSAALNGRYVECTVSDPLGRPIRARYLLAGDTAFIEMAAASGLPLLTAAQRNPLLTSTRGTGELILDALNLGVSSFVLAIGGSATNDGGTGLARALGARFLDAAGNDFTEGGGALGMLARIDLTGLDARLASCTFRVACDVDNPLTGIRGASAVYGPQKGATPDMVRTLDQNLAHLAAVIRRDFGRDIEQMPGTGAAGGLGGGLVAFLGATLEPGAALVMDVLGLEEHIRRADLVITGEGRTDFQTAQGKAPAAVAACAQKYGVPVLLLAGALGEGFEQVYACGITAAYSILTQPSTLEEAMQGAADNLRRTAESVIRTFLAGHSAHQ